jgi:hypothetical protein
VKDAPRSEAATHGARVRLAGPFAVGLAVMLFLAAALVGVVLDAPSLARWFSHPALGDGGARMAGRSAEWTQSAVPLALMLAASIILVLQNAGFVSSFMTGELAPAALERMLFTEEGIRGWMRLGQAKPGSAAAASALASLADQKWIAERDVEEIKRRAEEMAAEEQQNIQLRQNQQVPQ